MKYYCCIITIRTRNYEQVTLGVNPSQSLYQEECDRAERKNENRQRQTDRAGFLFDSVTYNSTQIWAPSASDHRQPSPMSS